MLILESLLFPVKLKHANCFLIHYNGNANHCADIILLKQIFSDIDDHLSIGHSDLLLLFPAFANDILPDSNLQPLQDFNVGG